MSKKLSNNQLKDIFNWIDDVPLSRPKRNFSRDFSDGVATAEVIKFYYPKLIDLHNYSPANSKEHKHYNWETLNNKVFNKINLKIPDDQINDIVNCVPGKMEEFLFDLKNKLLAYSNSKKHSKATKSVSNNSVATIKNDSNESESLTNSNSKVSIPNHESPSSNDNSERASSSQSTDINQNNESSTEESNNTETSETVIISDNEMKPIDNLNEELHSCCHCQHCNNISDNTNNIDDININNDNDNEDINNNDNDTNTNNNINNIKNENEISEKKSNNGNNIDSKIKKSTSKSNNIIGGKKKILPTLSTKSKSKIALLKNLNSNTSKTSISSTTKNRSPQKEESITSISSKPKTNSIYSTDSSNSKIKQNIDITSKQTCKSIEKTIEYNNNFIKKIDPKVHNLNDEYSSILKNKTKTNNLEYIKKNHELLISELSEKDKLIKDLQETVDILQLKTEKLEQLLLLKDKRIEELVIRLRAYGLL